MKRNFKGFTLVECIVALAVLAIASLTMAQIYASVSQRNRNNHLVNTSLANQMAYVEKYTGTEAYFIPYYSMSGQNGVYSTSPDPEADEGSTTKKPPHESKKNVTGTKPPYVKIVSSYDNSAYSYAADLYILKSRDTNDKDPDDADYTGEAQTDYDLRYKYLIGHNNG